MRRILGSDNTTPPLTGPQSRLSTFNKLTLSDLLWTGLVWSGLVWSGLVRSGQVWSGQVWLHKPQRCFLKNMILLRMFLRARFKISSSFDASSSPLYYMYITNIILRNYFNLLPHKNVSLFSEVRVRHPGLTDPRQWPASYCFIM